MAKQEKRYVVETVRIDRLIAGTKTQNVAMELRLITNFVRIGAFL